MSHIFVKLDCLVLVCLERPSKETSSEIKREARSCQRDVFFLCYCIAVTTLSFCHAV